MQIEALGYRCPLKADERRKVSGVVVLLGRQHNATVELYAHRSAAVLLQSTIPSSGAQYSMKIRAQHDHRAGERGGIAFR